MQNIRPFHLAFPVTSLARARNFYGCLLQCPEGRSSEHWVDFDLYGHQIVAHLATNGTAHDPKNEVDGKQVPVRHFGIVLSIYGFDFWLPQIVHAMGFSYLEIGFVTALIFALGATAQVFAARSSDAMGERIFHIIICVATDANGPKSSV